MDLQLAKAAREGDVIGSGNVLAAEENDLVGQERLAQVGDEFVC